MRELEFVRNEKLQEAWQDVQWNFMEDVERDMEGQIEDFLNRVLRIQADLQLRAGRYQRSLDRQDYRAGYRPRTVVTAKGTYELHVPRARRVALHFTVFDQYQRLWNRVNHVLCEIFLAGCSTRRTAEVLELLLGTRVSAQTVSRAVKALSPLVERFHARALEDHYRVLLLDGVTQSMRTLAGKAKKKLILVVYGITHTGQRELVDFRVAPSESEAAWYGFLVSLQHRGLEGESLELIVSDGSPGLIKALEFLCPNVVHQRCWAHKLRNVAEKVKKADEKRVLSGAKRIYLASSRREAVKAFRRWSDRWLPVYRSAVRCVERDLESLLTFFEFPAPMRATLRTTNLIERVFKEVRRRTRPIGCFTNSESCERIIYAIFAYQNAHWEKTPLPEFAHNS
jgi:putative transposase